MFKSVKQFSDDKAFRLIMENVEDLVAFIDTNFVYRAVSTSFANLIKLSVDDIIGKNIDVIHGEAIVEAHFKPHLIRALAGETVRFTTTVSRSGTNLLVEIIVVPSRNKQAQVVGVTLSARDITSQQVIRDGLLDEYSLSETIVNHSPDLIFLKSPKGIYVRCNPAFARFVGLKEEQIIGHSDSDLMSEKSARFIEERDQAVIKSGQPVHNEEWITYNNGDRRLVDMHKVPIVKDDGTLDGLLGIGRDITSEHQIAREKFQAALLFEATSDPCLILDDNGDIQAANPALVECLGYASHALVNLNVTHFLYDSNGGSSLRSALSSESWRGELMAIHISGKGLPFVASINRIPGTDRPGGYVLILADARTITSFRESLLDKAYHDSLTGLPNRLLLNARIEHSMRQAYRHACLVSVLFIDLDRFKQINDNFGHHVGDQLLCDVANRLKACLRQTDTLARLGGDEFVVVLDRISHEGSIKTAVEKLLTTLSDSTYSIEGNEHTVSASIGIAVYPEDASSSAKLIEYADIAMYNAKRSGRNQYCLYNDIKLV